MTQKLSLANHIFFNTWPVPIYSPIPINLEHYYSVSSRKSPPRTVELDPIQRSSSPIAFRYYYPKALIHQKSYGNQCVDPMKGGSCWLEGRE